MMTITIQRTSKSLKALKLIANLIQFFGIFIAIAGILNQSGYQLGTGAMVIAMGVLLHVFTVVMIWWNHG